MRRTLAVLVASFVPVLAHAAGQGETTVGGGPGLAVLRDGGTRAGGAAEVRLLRGLDDAWSARVRLQAAWLPARGDRQATQLFAPGLGLTVAADVVNLVPFLDVGVVLADLRETGRPSRQRLGAELAAGADYLLSRHLVLSLLARVDYLVLRLGGYGAPTPLLLTLDLHVGYVF